MVTRFFGFVSSMEECGRMVMDGAKRGGGLLSVVGCFRAHVGS